MSGSAALQIREGWTCLWTPPGEIDGPHGLDGLDGRDAIPARVPGTAAAAVRDARGEAQARALDYDGLDWWWRTTVTVPGAGEWRLRAEGLATVSDVWIDGRHVASGTSMFRAVVADLRLEPGPHDLVVRCAALSPLLDARRPRARWRTSLVSPNGLRWWRTSHLGRMPALAPDCAPVGPWRPVHLEPLDVLAVAERGVVARVEGTTGVLDVEVALRRAEATATTAILRAAGQEAAIPVSGREPRAAAVLRIPDAPLWWPSGYGDQALHDLELEVDGTTLPLGRAGFRTVELEDPEGDAVLRVNGVPVFARGACWVPPDVVSLDGDPAATRRQLETLRAAGATMVRVTGTAVYEGAAFWDACDELGLMVWQDAMLSTLDPPDDPAFLTEVAAELEEQLLPLQGRPSLVVVSGGSETEQQAVLNGLDADRRHIAVQQQTIPRVVAAVLPGTPYVTSSPSGGPLPTHSSRGVAHWFGVGAYLRPVTDVRRAAVRFAAECLALAAPPERRSLVARWGSEDAAVAAPEWRAGVPRDAGADWDFGDVRDHYVREVFGVDPDEERRRDLSRYLDLGRAACAHLAVEVMGEWRRPGSGCSGGLVLSARDLLPGPGWGLIDVDGRAKSSLLALRRVWAPVSLLVTDEGLDGVSAHVLNDAPGMLSALLEVDLVDGSGRCVESAAAAVDVAGRSGATVPVDAVLGVFRDLTYAYRFGPRLLDAVVLRLRVEGEVVAEAVHLVAGQSRAVHQDLGLHAELGSDDEGWFVDVSTAALAQWVAVEPEAHEPADSWFHLAPGGRRRVRLLGPRDAEPQGTVRALNGARPVRLTAPGEGS